MDASIRLQNELSNIRKARIYGFYARPSRRNIHHWSCQIHHGGYFYQLVMKFPQQYPMSPPVVAFTKPVYHPNVYSNNTVCLDLLAEKWCPSITVSDILGALAQLLQYPNPNSPANVEAAKNYRENRSVYEEKMEACNRKNHAHYVFLRD